MTKDDPEHPSASQIPIWARPPRDEVPCSVGAELLLGVSARAAVYISRPASYANGLLFDMVAVEQTGVLSGQRFLEVVNSPITENEHLPSEFLCLGVEFADGRRISNRKDTCSNDSIDSPPEIALTNLGAGNRFRRYDYCRYDWYLWPLPTIGDIVFSCEWPAFGIAESRATMSGGAVRKASIRAHGVWDAKFLP